MKVGFYQFKPIFGQKAKNLAKVTAELEKADAELLVLPELFATGYLFRNRKELEAMAEPIPAGETTQKLIEIAEKKKMFIVGGVAEKAGEDIYNSAILACPDRRVFTYRKVHLFLEEKSIFTPGDMPFPVFDIGKAKIGILICFDWIFPEASRILTLGGAQIICQPANLILPYAQVVTLTRALENRVFIILCNRIGKEQSGGRQLRFNGMSQIINSNGEIIFRANRNRETLMVTNINPKQALNKKFTKYNDVIKDRRPELYHQLIK